MSSALRGLAPREGLECLLVKMGRTGPLAEPRRGPQVGKPGDPRSQNTDTYKQKDCSDAIGSQIKRPRSSYHRSIQAARAPYVFSHGRI